jgi:chromosomal replication initiator protein
MNDFINSLRDKRIEGFKQRYRTYDLLLVDDVQFFEHKERIQEEFFHTFNSLYESGSQIVMSSDRRRATSRHSRSGFAHASSGG